jgi:hypothetical protein
MVCLLLTITQSFFIDLTTCHKKPNSDLNQSLHLSRLKTLFTERDCLSRWIRILLIWGIVLGLVEGWGWSSNFSEASQILCTQKWENALLFMPNLGEYVLANLLAAFISQAYFSPMCRVPVARGSYWSCKRKYSRWYVHLQIIKKTLSYCKRKEAPVIFSNIESVKFRKI